jgi:hypothetical protein
MKNAMNHRTEISLPPSLAIIIKCLSFAVKLRLQDELKFSSEKSIKLKRWRATCVGGKFCIRARECLFSAVQSTPQKECLSKLSDAVDNELFETC